MMRRRRDNNKVSPYRRKCLLTRNPSRKRCQIEEIALDEFRVATFENTSLLLKS
jgi:hypothetical protein